MNLLIYYNVNQKHFYIVYTNYINYYVGYENSYGHILVQILGVKNNLYVNVKNFYDLASIPWKKEKLKVRLINKLIRWLNKLK